MGTGSCIARLGPVGSGVQPPIMRTQIMVIGLNLYLSSQSICVVDFRFPTMGGPMLGNLNPLLFP